MILLVTYDSAESRRPTRWQAVHETIALHADDFQRPLFSQWLVETDDPPDAWRDRLTPLMEPEDSLLVTHLTDEYAGYLPDEIWTWIELRL